MLKMIWLFHDGQPRRFRAAIGAVRILPHDRTMKFRTRCMRLSPWACYEVRALMMEFGARCLFARPITSCGCFARELMLLHILTATGAI